MSPCMLPLLLLCIIMRFYRFVDIHLIFYFYFFLQYTPNEYLMLCDQNRA